MRAGLDLAVEGAARAGIDPAEVARLTGAVLDELGVDGPCALGVAFVGARRMRELNRAHRGRDAVTDVLSFPIDGLDTLPDGVERQLGDVVVCPARARAQALEARVAPGEELRTLLVHGLLHLVGLDHEMDEGEMLARQDALAARLDALAWAG